MWGSFRELIISCLWTTVNYSHTNPSCVSGPSNGFRCYQNSTSDCRQTHKCWLCNIDDRNMEIVILLLWPNSLPTKLYRNNFEIVWLSRGNCNSSVLCLWQEFKHQEWLKDEHTIHFLAGSSVSCRPFEHSVVLCNIILFMISPDDLVREFWIREFSIEYSISAWHCFLSICHSFGGRFHLIAINRILNIFIY